jgi:hypothetical protein
MDLKVFERKEEAKPTIRGQKEIIKSMKQRVFSSKR